MSTPTIPITLDLAATLSGTIPAGNLPIGSDGDHVAAGDDPRLVNAPRVVASIDALRTLPAPVPGVDSGHVIVQGYYGPGTAGGGEFLYDFTAAPGIVTGFFCDSGYQLGSGYPQGGITLTFSPPDQPGGTQATAVVTSQFPSAHTQAGGISTVTVTNPGSGYLQAPTVTVSPAAPSSFQTAVLHPTGNWDDGGRIIVGQGQGVWRRIGVSPATVDTDEYGVVYNDVSKADDNSKRLAAARRALPINSPISQGPNIAYGRSNLVPPATVRKGTLLTHGGTIYLGDTLLLTPELVLSCGSEHTIFAAKPSFASSAAAPRYLLQLALNTEYVNTTYPALPSPQIDATYNCVIDGFFTLLGNRSSDNAGVLGAYLLGAQGCKITRELQSEDMASGGLVTNFSAPRLTSLSGINPLIFLQNSYGNEWDDIDVEHGVVGGNDSDGNPHRMLRIEAVRGIRIGYLSHEVAPSGQSLGCTVKNATGRIQQVEENVMDALFLLEAGGNLTIGSMESVGTQKPGLWIDDRNTGAQLPQGTPSYEQNLTLRGTLTAPSIAGDTTLNSILTCTGLSSARNVQGYFNPMPVHTGLTVKGTPITSETEYSARESLHWGNNSANSIFTALRNHPIRGFERVFGLYYGDGTETEQALLNQQGFTLKTGTFHGDGSGLTNLTLPSSALPAASAVYNGRLWYDGTHFYGCNGTAWKQLDN